MSTGFALAVSAAALALPAATQVAVTDPPPVPAGSSADAVAQTSSPLQRVTVVAELRRLVETSYVFPERRGTIVDVLRRSLESGRYDVASAELFAKLVSEDLARASDDKHLMLKFDPAEYANKVAQRDRSDYSGIKAQIRRNNHGYVEQKLLSGNIRYVRIADFRWIPGESEAAVDSAARFLAGGDAIILDLRGNAGGDPRAVQYLVSHFFERETELAGEFDGTTGHYQPLRTHSDLPAGPLTSRPLFVLIDGSTFSAGEAFAYEVQQYRLGRLVGAKTAGGANGATRHPLPPNFIASVPYLRLVHPLTKTNWEGVGVPPDVASSGSAALDQALLLALSEVRATAPASARREIEWAITAAGARLAPVRAPASALQEVAGTYGTRALIARGDELFYRRHGQQPVRLVPLAADLFQVGPNEDLRLRIRRIGDRVAAIELMSLEGVLASETRTSAQPASALD